MGFDTICGAADNGARILPVAGVSAPNRYRCPNDKIPERGFVAPGLPICQFTDAAMNDHTLTLDERDLEPRSDRDKRAPGLCRILSADRIELPPWWIPLDASTEVVRGSDGLGKEADGFVLSLDDGRVSRPHARFVPTVGQMLLEDRGSKNGTFVNGEAVKSMRLADGALVEIGRSFFVFHGAVPTSAFGRLPLRFEAPPLAPVDTASPLFADVLDALRKAAPAAVAVLLHGETGTGKEVLARRLHALSGRTGALVAVNCGALPRELIEAELFGAKKGAYSGATFDRQGLVRAADGGTLFLDEIGDLPLAAQAALLRVLQEKAVVPVGATAPVAVDFRLVSATHRDLAAEVAAGRFRADLLARLSGVTLTPPPLRSRREDMGALVNAFCARMAPGATVRFTVRASRALLQSTWPANVRGLERAIEGALALAPHDEQGHVLIDLEHLPDLDPAQSPATPAGEHDDEAPLNDAFAEQLTALLRTHRGNVSAVARELGKKRMQVYRYIDRYRLKPDAFR
jgi:transcriptional regulator with AAA-type ATPase domain